MQQKSTAAVAAKQLSSQAFERDPNTLIIIFYPATDRQKFRTVQTCSTIHSLNLTPNGILYARPQIDS